MSNIVTLRGKTFVINSESTTVDPDGLITGTVVYLPKPAEYILVGLEGPAKGDTHPLDSRLTVEKVSMEYREGEGSLVATYTGLVPDETDPENPDSVPVYSLDYGLSEEPITTHPDFDTFAGTPDSPVGGAVFYSSELNKEATEDDPNPTAADNDKFAFARFAADSEFAGMESFLDPATATYTESYTTTTRPTAELSGAGQIDNPPNAPTTTRDWLYMGASYEERGDVFSVTRVWKLSGPNGWNATIYP